jgi:uncharacterized protein YjlB
MVVNIDKKMDVISPRSFYLQENESMPNNSGLPVLVYRKVLEPQSAEKDKKFQNQFEKNNWKGVWKNGIYDYHHFHSTSHEVLGVASGAVDIQLGGWNGKILILKAGDLVILPAGTGHKRLSASENFMVVGAYPAGQEEYDICRHKNDCDENLAEVIADVPLPDSDPFYGAAGPLLKNWKKLQQAAII